MLKYIKFIVILIVLASCANPLPPPGGPPDKTPPAIEETEPLNGMINFQGDEINIGFSKYMNKSKVIENIYISPPLKVKYSWSGKVLNIEFVEKPDSNTTYSVTMGTEYSDIYENKPEKAYSLIFSTGDIIDSASINGMLYGAEKEGVYIYCYRIDQINPDTLTLTMNKPKYRVQVGSSGTFSLKALKEGTYRLVAVKDAYNNEIYDSGFDTYSAAWKDIVVVKDSVPEIKLKAGKIIDRNKPKLLDVISSNNRIIYAVFDESIDTTSLSSKSFVLTDSSSGQQYDINSAYIEPGNGSKVGIISKYALESGKKYKLECSIDTINAIRDLSKNIINDTLKHDYFISSGDSDSTISRVLNFALKDSSLNVPRDFLTDLVFSLGIDNLNLEEKVRVINLKDSSLVKLIIRNKGANQVHITSLKPLENNSWYVFNAELKGLVGANGVAIPDTVLYARFQSVDARQYAGISGILKDSVNTSANYILVLHSKDNPITRSAAVAADGKWKFSEIPAGKYFFEVFIDSNSNGEYDFGNDIPFSFSEKFKIFDNEIIVKPRWDVENIILWFQ
jgi:hypothetical protein